VMERQSAQPFLTRPVAIKNGKTKDDFDVWLVDYLAGKDTFELKFLRFIEEKIREDEEDSGPEICEAAQELLDAGIPIHYSDEEYPGETVKEYPDGRREIIDLDENWKEFVVREIPPSPDRKRS
jgi:hypothetical protein